MAAPTGPSLRRPLASLDAEGLVTGAGTVLAVAALAGFFVVGRRWGPDAWVPVLVAVVLTAVSVPIVLATADRPLDRRLRTILLVAFALKMACAVPRYLMNEVAYDGAADAAMYHEAGTVLREHALEGRWSLDGAFAQSFPSETRFVAYVTGMVYLAIGSSQMGGYLVFTWIGWLGLVCVFRAFRIGFPNAPPYLAAGLIFFLPSTLYWPSSIGKDALMVLGVGLVTLGLARLLAGNRPGLGVVWLVLGGTLFVEVRPHLLLISLVGGAVSLIARRAPHARNRSALVGRGLLLAALVPVLVLGVGRMDRMFGSTVDAGSFSVTSALERAGGRTDVGGSAFETSPVHSPVDLPVATVNVLFRPFLFEAGNVAALVSALEGTVLLLGAVFGARWLWRIGPAMWRSPLAAFCGGYAVAFVFAFSNIGNAGILARQRVQLFPVLMLLVAAAAEHRRLNAGAPAADRNPASDASPVGTLDPRLVLPR